MFHSKFLDTTEAQSMKKTFHKAYFTKIKIKTTLQRTMSRKWKNKLQTERKYFQDTADKALLCKVYKQLLKLNN